MNATTAKSNLKRIANFELQELIGAGGMANIYKGIQLSLERPVAIKVLHQHLTVNEGFVNRFKQEAKQAAILQHQNIVSIIDYGHQDDEYFIAMEYIDGQNLKEILTRIKRFPLEVAMLIAREVANGLKYAHSQGLIHRDIKPANIMLSREGRVVITDFGIAKTYGDMSITVTGQTIGSPAYMSPEQAAGRPIDHRCDIFSMGIVLYEIMTGEKPFKGDSYQEAMTSVISEQPAAPSSLRIDVTPTMEKIINKALMKDIESRYQDADELIEGLNDLLSSYVIPSEKKIVAEFVKNPIRTTQKLRSDRISKHMESALYYVNIGHGRLSDAIKEFENVLRYDKNNKLAKQYLDKLKSGQDDFSGGKKRKKFSWQFWGMTSLTIISLLAALSLWIYEKNKSLLPETGSREATVETSRRQSPAEPEDQLKTRTDDISSVPSSSAKKGEPAVTMQKLQPGKTTSKVSRPVSQNVHYAYPNQDLKKFGLLRITSDPPAKFSVDFKEYGMTGGPEVKLSPGRHVISIDAKGFEQERKRIFTEEGKSESLDIKLKPEE